MRLRLTTRTWWNLDWIDIYAFNFRTLQFATEIIFFRNIERMKMFSAFCLNSFGSIMYRNNRPKYYNSHLTIMR